MKMLALLGIFIFSISAFAMNGRTTYQAKIVKPDGYPLQSSSVNFRFTVLDPAASCVLYVEDYAAINMIDSGGLISFALGGGVRSFPTSGTPQTFQNTFDNSINSFSCQSPGIYNPTPTDVRKVVMQFNDGNGWQTLPAMTINAVPYAMYANKSNDSKTLNGKADTAFVETSTLAALNCNAATHAITFNGVSFSCIPVGVSSSGITSVTTSGTVLLTGGTASAPVISIQAATLSQDGYLTSLDYAEFKAKLSASSTQIINTLGYAPVSSSAVATQINNSNLSGDVSGTVSSNSVVSVGGKTAAQVSTSVNDTLAATASATASTIVKRDSSGNITINDIYANAAKLNYVDIYKPSTSFNIRLQAPTSLSTNYVLNLPTTSGTTGQVLSTDGSGNLSWINPSTGSVVSVSATAPLASTGGSNPTISITQATSSTNGYLSSTDWNTFNNKQQATSAAIIATLGYIPADNAASGTYAQKANNLNDLTNFATARSNLGLGTFATANSIDLGSASATGTLATARLPSFSGDVSSVSGSNLISLNTVGAGVTSGTQYTKVTVDGKGRVTSGAQLSSSDVTTALGYTPSNSTSGVTSLNGSTSQTQTFSIGTSGNSPAYTTANGVHTLNIPLANTGSVTAGLLSNSDYTTFNNKQTATSAAIIATLGYTPADNSASGTYAQKANNLSDLTNFATARANLGLGTFATANSIDLGSASATGIIADSRLASQTNVTSGTQYTKVTVDGKGRVTSGAQLSSSDVTTALGYTPSNSSSGVTSLNGSTSQTQTFANGTNGTAPAFSTAAGVHTLNIPLASAASVTGGLLSNADYTTFNNKQNATSAAIITTLGYTPANSATLGNLAWVNFVDLGTSQASGTLAVARLPSFSGDVNSVSGSNSIMLNTVGAGVTSGTQYTKVTVDGKGRVTSGAQLSSSDVTTALGYTPATSTTLAASFVQKAGDTMTGALILTSGTTSLAPLKFTSGTLLSSQQSGAMEYDGFNFYLTDSTPTRRTIATGSSAGTIDNAQTINSSSNISLVPNSSVIVSSTTASTSSNNGALVVKGGLGVAGNINTAGSLNVSGSSVIDGSLKLSSMTSGSVLFAGANGTVTQDNSSLFWDGANKRLGIGSNSPAQTLSVSGASYFSGNVGIGTTSPSYKLDIADGNARISSSNSAYTALMIANTVSGHSLTYYDAINGDFVGGDYGYVGQNNSGFMEYNIGSASPMPYHVFSGGNVGIGTATPFLKLDVSGNIRAVNTDPTANSFFALGQTFDGATPFYIQRHGSTHATMANGVEIWNAENSFMRFATNSIERLRIDASGNVGIGTTSPSSRLQIGDSIASTSNQLIFGKYEASSESYLPLIQHKSVLSAGVSNDLALGAQSTTGGIGFYTGVTGTLNQLGTGSSTLRMVINSTGNVGIGTTSPQQKLHIGEGGILRIQDNDNTAPHGYVEFGVTDTGSWSRRGYIGLPGAASAEMVIAAEGNSTPIYFKTSTGTAMTVSGTNVGIGTNAPERKFHLHESSIGGANPVYMKISNGDTGVAATDGLFIGFTSNEEATISNAEATPLRFDTSNLERMRIDAAGNVGVGTTTPNAKLDVNGTVAFGGGKGSLSYYLSGPYDQAEFSAVGASTSLSLVTNSISRLNITPAGNVGIGTTAPTSKLTIAGDIQQTACGSGKVFVYNNFCYDSAERAAAPIASAQITCLQAGGHLCDEGELNAVCTSLGMAAISSGTWINNSTTADDLFKVANNLACTNLDGPPIDGRGNSRAFHCCYGVH